MDIDAAVSPPPAPTPPSDPRIALKPSRTGRIRFLPSQFRDSLPSLSKDMPNTFQAEDVPVPPPPHLSPESSVSSRQSSPGAQSEPPAPMTYINTKPDEFGVYRSYPELPCSIPDEEIVVEDICDGAGFPVPPPSNPLSVFGNVAQKLNDNIIAPFLNITIYRLMNWFYNGNQVKSIADLDTLVNDVLLPDDFSQDHLTGFGTQKVLKEMDEYGDTSYILQPEDGWIEASVRIPVPCTGHKQSEADAPIYEVKGLYYRKPLEIIKSVFQSDQSKKFHYTPFKLYQQRSSPTSPDPISVRLHSELYSSNAFIDEHEKVQRQQQERCLKDPDNPSLQVPSALVGIMLWSDATKVGTWGDASMWPIYLYFGNQSKYDRAKPSAFAAHHLAYVPKVFSFLFRSAVFFL